MELTGCLLLIAVVSAVESFPINIPIAAQTFGYSQAIPLRSPQQLSPQPQLYSFNQESLNHLIGNNRFNQPQQQQFQIQQQQQRQQQQYQQQIFRPQLPNLAPRFNNVPQQNYLQQQRLPQQEIRVAQQPFYETSFSPVQTSNSGKQLSSKKSPIKTQESSNSDFLSSLQIIDTNGRIRDLRDFGLGGAEGQSHEPELERELRSIFDTINRDLEHAAFLPLDINGANNQLGNILTQYHQSDQQQTIAENPRNQEGSVKELPAQQQESSHQQQPLGYSFTQPQQHQFQFLRPQRANTLKSEQPIRSPAQTIRDGKTLSQNKEEQAPIQQIKEDVPEIKDSIEISKQKIENTASKTPQVQIESKERRQQPELKSPVKVHENFEQYRQPQVEQQKINIPNEQHRITPNPIAQEQQQPGFDDEPAPLKAVEHDSTQKFSGQSHSKESNQVQKQQPPAKGKGKIEQPVFDEESNNQQEHQNQQPQIQQQQQNYEDDRSTVAQSNLNGANKYDGWVPVTQSIIEQQRVREPQQVVFEQQREDQHISGQKQVGQKVEPQLEQLRLPEFDSNQQKTDEIPTRPVVQPIFSQQVPTKDAGKKVISKKKFSTFGSGQSFNEQQQEKLTQQQESEIFQEQERQIKEQLPEQQQQNEQQSFQQNGQRLDTFSQQREPTKVEDQNSQEQYSTTQREEVQKTISSTTERPIFRPEQGVKGRKVKMVQNIRTPIQRARDQQSKSIKQQQRPKQELPVQQNLSPQESPVQQNLATKNSKQQSQQIAQLKQVQKSSFREKPKQVAVEINEQSNLDEPTNLPIAPNAQLETKPTNPGKQEFVSQQQLSQQEELPEPQQEREPEQQKQEFSQQKETSQQTDTPLREPEPQKKEQQPVAAQQAEQQLQVQQEETPLITQQQADTFEKQKEPLNDEVQIKQDQQTTSQADDFQPITSTTTQKPTQRARKVKQQGPRLTKTRDQGVRLVKVQLNNVRQQQEAQQVQEVQTSTDEPVTIVPITTTTATQTIFNEPAKQEEISQQQQLTLQEESKSQQQRLEDTQQPQQQQDFVPQQQTDFVPQQQPDFTPQQQDFTSQQQELPNQQQEVAPQQKEVAFQQENNSQQEVNLQQQENTQEPEQPRVTQLAQQEEVSTQTSEQFKLEPQQKEQANDEEQLKQEQFTTTQRDELITVTTTTPRPPIRRNLKGFKSRKAQQIRVASVKQQQQAIRQPQVQEEVSQYREENSNQKFNIDPNTYNPLQFEPERISSLTRDTQTTNVNSGEPY